MAGPSGTTTNTYYRYTASFIIVENRGLNISITRTRGAYDYDKVEVLNQTEQIDRERKSVLIPIATHFIACVLGLEVTTLSKKYLDEIMLV